MTQTEYLRIVNLRKTNVETLNIIYFWVCGMFAYYSILKQHTLQHEEKRDINSRFCIFKILDNRKLIDVNNYTIY